MLLCSNQITLFRKRHTAAREKLSRSTKVNCFFHLSNFIFRLRRQDELKFIETKVDFSGMYISDSTSHWKNGFKRSRMSITLLYDHVE